MAVRPIAYSRIVAADALPQVVIGGSTAGSALATRLSQGLLNNSILLIKAGPEASEEDCINIPGIKGSTLSTVYN